MNAQVAAKHSIVVLVFGDRYDAVDLASVPATDDQ
jgi:hypothetical protein